MEHEYTFNGQRDDEDVLDVVKNHPFVLFMPGLKAVFLMLIGIAIIIFWQNQYSSLIALVFILVAFATFFRKLVDYSQSSFVITNQRVINVEQGGFLKRRIIEAELGKIQDVSSEVGGLFKAMLKYGNLVIRTASGDGSKIIVEDIANPYSVQQEIAKLLRK